MIIPDKPISSLKEDLLGRAPFAQRLGNTIRDWKEEESVVLGLFGPWGCGKTSILNMAIGHIEKSTNDWEKEKKPIIIKFNPWNFSEQNTLLLSYFQHLFSVVDNKVSIKNRDFRKQIDSLAKALGAFEVLPGFGRIFVGAEGLLKRRYPPETLDELKEKVAKYFKSLDRRIIIVMDDIDRLTNIEIRQLFQLIKINADFPNTIYLLAFDRNIVENALSREQNNTGRAYLEKIVQVGFDVPIVHATLIQQYLFKHLDEALTNLPEERWDNERWDNLFHAGFKAFFRTLRDVKRFLGSFAFNFASVFEEVNPVDFVCIEALRVFAPNVYQEISANKELFTKAAGFNLGNQQKAETARTTFEEIFNKAEDDREATKRICLLLFPRVAEAYDESIYGGRKNGSWRGTRRVSDPDIFDTYFILSTPPGIVSRVELQQVIDKCENPSELVTIFNGFTNDGKILNFLKQLSDITNNLDVDQAKGLSRALMILGGELPNIQHSFVDLGSDFTIALNVYRLLEKISEEDRCEWLAAQIPTLPSLYSVIYIIAQDEPREGKERQEKLFSVECIDKLKNITVERINQLADEGQLTHQKKLQSILLHWKRWSKDQNPSMALLIERAKGDRELVLEILAGFLYDERTQTIGDYLYKTNQALNYKGLQEFLDPEIIINHLSSMSTEEIEELNEYNKIAVREFLEKVKQQSEQQADE